MKLSLQQTYSLAWTLIDQNIKQRMSEIMRRPGAPDNIDAYDMVYDRVTREEIRRYNHQQQEQEK